MYENYLWSLNSAKYPKILIKDDLRVITPEERIVDDIARLAFIKIDPYFFKNTELAVTFECILYIFAPRSALNKRP